MAGTHRGGNNGGRRWSFRVPRLSVWQSIEIHRIASGLLVIAAPAISYAVAHVKDGKVVTGLLVLQLGVAGTTWGLGEGRAKRIDRERVEAAQEMLVGIGDALEPTMNKLGEFARESKAGRRSQRSGMISTVLSAAYGLGPADSRSRACYFKLNAQGDCMEAVESKGRAGSAKARFAAGTVEGDSALAMVRAGEMLFCDDVRENPPPGWVQSARGEYQTFISVSVQCGGVAFGMLTLDAIEPGSLTKEDGAMLQVLGHILGIVESMSA